MTKSAEPHLQIILDSLRLLISRMPTEIKKLLDDGILQDATLMRLQEAGEQLVQIRDHFLAYYQAHRTDS